MSIKKTIINKQASFQYILTDKREAGLVLLGSEIKSLRSGRCNLKAAYIAFIREEAFLQKAHISPYKNSIEGGHDPERSRKLLLHKSEIKKLRGLVEQKKMTCVPLKIYFKQGRAKIEISLGIGKNQADKRQHVKKRQDQRHIERNLKKYKR